MILCYNFSQGALNESRQYKSSDFYLYNYCTVPQTPGLYNQH